MKKMLTTGDVCQRLGVEPRLLGNNLLRWRANGWLYGEHPGGSGKNILWEEWTPRMTELLVNEGVPNQPELSAKRGKVYEAIAGFLHSDPTIEWFVVSDDNVTIADTAENALKLARIMASGILTCTIYLPQ